MMKEHIVFKIENALGSIDANVQVTTVDNISMKPATQPIITDLKQHDTLVLALCC